MKISRRLFADFAIPIAILVVMTALIAGTGLDLALEGRFYLPGTGWTYAQTMPWQALYRYGVFPAYAIGIGSLLVVLAGFFTPRLSPYRKSALFLLLLLMLGPGVLVNSVFKEHWGRPRPRQMQLFGGDRAYHQVWERGEGGKGQSFPSGHASAAFYLIAPYFVLRRRSRKLAGAALCLGTVYGGLMGVARMVQGGHFPSDVLWAWGCVYLVGLTLSYLLGLEELDAKLD